MSDSFESGQRYEPHQPDQPDSDGTASSTTGPAATTTTITTTATPAQSEAGTSSSVGDPAPPPARRGGIGPAATMPAGVTPGLLTAAVGALVTFLAAFLTWATVEVTSRAGGPLVGGGTRSVIGLEGDRLGKATLVLAVASLVLVALLVAPASRPWGWIPLASAGGLIAALAVLDLVSISDASDLRERLAQVPGCVQVVRCSGDRSAGVGVYLTILGGLAVLVGALLHAKLAERALGRSRARRAVRPQGAAEPSATAVDLTKEPDIGATATPPGTPTATRPGTPTATPAATSGPGSAREREAAPEPGPGGEATG